MVPQAGQELLSQLHVVVEDISARDSSTWAGDGKSHPCWRPEGDHQLLRWSHPELSALKIHQSLTPESFTTNLFGCVFLWFFVFSFVAAF